MLKRTWSLLLVLALVTAPGVAFGAAPDREARRAPDLIERIWNEVLHLLGIDGEGASEQTREAESPRSMTNQGGGGYDPDG